MKLKTISLTLFFITSYNLLADQELSLEIIASKISERLIIEEDNFLLNKVTDDSILPPELQEIIRNELIKTYLKHFQLQPTLYAELIGHTGAITSLAFSPNGEYALTGSIDNTARLWDLTKKPPIESQKLSGHTGAITSVAFSPNGEYALTGSKDGKAMLWNLTINPIEPQELIGHTAAINAVVFSADGKQALTGSADHTARLWDLTTKPIRSRQLIGHGNSIKSVALSSDGKYALTNSNDGSAMLWLIKPEPIIDPLQIIVGNEGLIDSIAFSPDSKYAVIVSDENTTIKLLDLTTRQWIELKGYDDKKVTSVASSTDGRYVLIGSLHNIATLWDLTKMPPELNELIGNTGFIDSVIFSPNSKYAIINNEKLLDLTKVPVELHKKIPVESHKFGKTDQLFEHLFAFDPNGKYVLEASRDRQDKIARLWLLNPILNRINQLNISQLVLANKINEWQCRTNFTDALINNSKHETSI